MSLDFFRLNSTALGPNAAYKAGFGEGKDYYSVGQELSIDETSGPTQKQEESHRARYTGITSFEQHHVPGP